MEHAAALGPGPASRGTDRAVTFAEAPDRVEIFRARFTAVIDAGNPTPAARRWRLGVFERGLRLAKELESRFGPLRGRRVLDVGAAYGGDVVAFCARGADCVGADLLDYQYDRLCETLQAGDALRFERFDCTRPWPLADASFDVVLALSVLELVPDLDAFFAELFRVLRPGGIGVVETATVVRMARCDPLYKLPLVGMLPTRVRVWIAERFFQRHYEFPVAPHTFWSARTFVRFARRHGYTVEPCKFADSPLMARLDRWPLRRVWQALARWLAFDFVLLRPAQ